ncbi:MAG: SRPBCC family protein, partial [Parvularculaceae bacterium]|nr:SRPBCC family protein [Parvularculaceae bacterium]
QKPAAEIAAIIRDVEGYPRWRGVVVEDVVVEADAVTYVEISEGDRIAFRLTEPIRDGQFVATMTDPALPFGGRWTITLTPDDSATRVRIEEDGEIRDPLYRFFAHFVFGYTSSMKSYLKNLGASEIAEPNA